MSTGVPPPMSEEFELPKDLKNLQEQLATALKRIEQLESEKIETPEERTNRIADKSNLDSALEVAPISEADITLRRLVQRIAMILQAEKIVIMFFDREAGDLRGIPPS